MQYGGKKFLFDSTRLNQKAIQQEFPMIFPNKYSTEYYSKNSMTPKRILFGSWAKDQFKCPFFWQSIIDEKKAFKKVGEKF